MAKKKLPLRVFKNDVLFQFEDDAATLHDGRKSARGFKETTSWGFVFTSSKESASNARWGIVKATGPEIVDDIYTGRRVLVENLKWTDPVKFDGQEYWKTTEDFVLCVDTTEDRNV